MGYDVGEISGGVKPVGFVAYCGFVEEIGLSVVGCVYGPGGANGKGLVQEFVEKGFIDFFGGADAMSDDQRDFSAICFWGVLFHGESQLVVLFVSNASAEAPDVGSRNDMLNYGP